jgi:uncharacterized protein YbjQ (UPF0145 family)
MVNILRRVKESCFAACTKRTAAEVFSPLRTKQMKLKRLSKIIIGEIEEYTKMMAEAREQAIDRMVADAINMGANGIVGIRFTTSTVLQGAAELVAYGTGVKLENRAKKIQD